MNKKEKPKHEHEIKRINIAELKPDASNPKQHSPGQIAAIKRSIEEFGFTAPVIAMPDGTVVAGHARLQAALQLGISEVPVVVLSGMTEQEAKLYLLADNKLAELASWDFSMLAQAFDSLSMQGCDLSLTGFSPEEIALIRQKPVVEDGFDVQAAVAEIETPETKLGDVWILGRHRLVCGDSTDRSTITRLMAGQKSKLSFTSPPYWTGMKYETQKSVEEIREFIGKSAAGIAEATRQEKSRIVINTGTGYTTSFDKKNKRQTLLLVDWWTDSFRALGWNLRHVRHWIKDGQLRSTASKSDVIDQHCEFLAAYDHDQFRDVLPDGEVSLMCTFFAVQGEYGGQYKTGKSWALRGYWDDIHGAARKYGHEAPFPVELAARHIWLYTLPDAGDVVLDVFAGSGTTGIACEQMGRTAYMCELSPVFCDVLRKRWEAFTGRKSVLAQREEQVQV